MDLLNNSTTAVAVGPAKQVNNLVSPKTNNLMAAMESAGVEADDEQSPVRLPKAAATEGDAQK